MRFNLIMAIVLICLLPYSQAFAEGDPITLYCNHWNNVGREANGTGCFILCGTEYYFCADSHWSAMLDDWFCQANEEPCLGANEGDRCMSSYRRDYYSGYHCDCIEPVLVCEEPGGWQYGWDYLGDWEVCYVCP